MPKRWALFLPLLHVVLAAGWIIRDDFRVWSFLPRMQAAKDFERVHPPSAEELSFAEDVAYEYRPSIETRAIVFVNPIPALIAGYEHRLYPSEKALSEPFFPDRLRLKTRMVLFESLLLSLVALQWFLLGRWLDRRLIVRKDISIALPSFLISGLAVATAVFSWIYAALWRTPGGEHLAGICEWFAILCVLIAFLIWVLWAVAALGLLIGAAVQKLRSLAA